MNVYIAGKYEARARLIEWRGRIIALGHTVSSTWLDETANREDVSPEYEKAAALRDIEEICNADLFILDEWNVSNSGGREVEFGVAYLRGCDLWIVGPKRNIFHTLADRIFESWPEAVNYLRGI